MINSLQSHGLSSGTGSAACFMVAWMIPQIFLSQCVSSSVERDDLWEALNTVLGSLPH